MPQEHCSFNFNSGLNFVAQWENNTYVKENSVYLTNVKYASISKSELKDLDVKTIPTSITYSLKNAQAREDIKAFLTVSAIVKTGNTFKKVTSFTVNYTNSKTPDFVTPNLYQFPVFKTELEIGCLLNLFIDVLEFV